MSIPNDTKNDSDNDRLFATQQMLAKHHRDGPQFADMMKSSYSGRFDQAFWSLWQDQIEAKLNADSLVLDLGTGPGNFLVELGRRYPLIRSIGVECAAYMLQAMEELPPRAEIITADLHDPSLPIDANSVDVAVASVVLHEMTQPMKTFFEMFRCLKPGGVLYILDWVRVPLQQYIEEGEENIFDPAADVDQLQDLFQHFIEHNRFSVADLHFMLENVGFEINLSEPLFNARQVRILAVKPE